MPKLPLTKFLPENVDETTRITRYDILNIEELLCTQYTKFIRRVQHILRYAARYKFAYNFTEKSFCYWDFVQAVPHITLEIYISPNFILQIHPKHHLHVQYLRLVWHSSPYDTLYFDFEYEFSGPNTDPFKNGWIDLKSTLLKYYLRPKHESLYICKNSKFCNTTSMYYNQQRDHAKECPKNSKQLLKLVNRIFRRAISDRHNILYIMQVRWLRRDNILCVMPRDIMCIIYDMIEGASSL
jgi:hypothetical protein